MFTVDAAISISRPIEAVFGYVSAAANIPKWRPEVVSVSGAPESLSAGSEFDETFNFIGRKTSRMRVTAFESGRRLVIKALTGPMLRPTQTFTFSPVGATTRIDVHVDMDVDGWAMMLQPLFKGMIQKLWAKYLANLKRELE